MLSFGSPPLKEGSQAQIAAAFFSFVSYFDQTRQSRGKRLCFPTLAQRAPAVTYRADYGRDYSPALRPANKMAT
jgi:hypothetical protein